MTNVQILVIVLILVALWIYFQSQKKENLLEESSDSDSFYSATSRRSSLTVERDSEVVESSHVLSSKEEINNSNIEREREREQKEIKTMKETIQNFEAIRGRDFAGLKMEQEKKIKEKQKQIDNLNSRLESLKLRLKEKQEK